jgi:hypothetical protein
MNKWGTACGVWGDIIVGLGYFKEYIGSGKILYLGNNDQIVDFLKAQTFITDVKKVPIDEYEWRRYWIYTVFNKTPKNMPEYKTTVDAPFLKAGFQNNEYIISHLTLDKAKPDQPIYQWTNAKLPSYVEEWAKEKAKTLPEKFYLYQPFSLNSNSVSDHWKDWDRLTSLIITRTNNKLVLVCHNWPPDLKTRSKVMFNQKIISLYNEVPSMMHIFALAKYATAIITTSNSLAHWCQASNLPCLVICNRKSTREQYIFRRVLEWPTIGMVEYTDDAETAYNKCGEWAFSHDHTI